VTLPTGTRLGPYEIVAPLGVGGMGEVYRARDSRLGREVALKVLPEELSADSDRLARFEREARSASALNHPHIVTVYDVGRADSLSYIAMELVDGRTLRELLAKGPLSAKRMLSIAAQAADALAKAHSAAIVHRDLKPENVMVSKDGFVKILDFGLAKLVAAPVTETGTRAPTAIEATRPGVVLGTVGYMSPEQARGVEVDFRSDQFSFGSILYEMASGRRAFQKDSAPETMAAIIREEPEALSRATPASPAPYRWIVERCLAKDPDERYASTRDLSRELADLRDHLSEVEGSRATAAATGPARRIRPSRLLLGASVFAALALGLLAGRWLARPEPTEPSILRPLTYSGHDSSPAVSPDGQTVAFTSDRDGTARIWLKQLAGGGEAALTSGDDDFPRFSPDGAAILFVRREGGSSALYRTATLGGEPRKLAEEVMAGDWSPDGKRIAFVRWKVRGAQTDTVLGTVAADGSQPRKVATFPNGILVHPRWSPDGKTIAATAVAGLAGAPSSILLVDAADGSSRQLASALSIGILSSVAWTGDGREIVYAQAESVVGTMTASPARIFRQRIDSGRPRAIFWSPSNGAVLDVLGSGALVFDIRSPRENLREISVDPGKGLLGAERWLTRGNSTDRQPAYSPDGEWVVFSSNRSGNLDLWKVSRKSGAVRRLTDDAAEDWDPGFSPDGKNLLWSSKRSGNFEIWIAESDGSGARQLTRDGLDAENPMATRDGQWVLYASGNPSKPGVWKIRPDGSGAQRIVSGFHLLAEPSPDGQHVAYVTNTNRFGGSIIHVSRVSDGSPVPFEVAASGQTFVNIGVLIGRMRWMPDGRSIVYVGMNQRGETGLYRQEFAPGLRIAPQRALGGFDPENATESFAISPDGACVTIAGWEQISSVVVAEHVPGVDPPRRVP
jgi:eukaryotic-like serine/threonine-protein kinase